MRKWPPTCHAERSEESENEVWSFGEEAYEIIKGLLFLRERLRPYIDEQMCLAHEKGIPPMRPLFFDFPDDPESANIDDEFLFGPICWSRRCCKRERAAAKSICQVVQSGQTPGQGKPSRVVSIL